MLRVVYSDRTGQQVATISENELAEMRRDNGKIILKVSKSFTFGRKINQNDIIATFEMIADMLESGYPLDSIISDAAESAKKCNPQLAEVLTSLKNSVNSGRGFAESLTDFSSIFGHHVCAMVAAGEEAGKLGETLNSVAEQMQTTTEMRREMFKQFAYPAVQICVSLVVLFGLALVGVPMMTKTEAFKRSMASDKNGLFFMNLMLLLAKVMPLLIVAILILAIAFIIWWKTQRGKAEEFLAKIPILNTFVFHKTWFFVWHSLSNFLEAGLRLEQALTIVERMVIFTHIKRQISAAIECVRRGESFVMGFDSLPHMERMLLANSTREERIEKHLRTVAKRYFRDFLRKIKAVAPVVNTASIICTALMVIILWLGTNTPYIKMLRGFSR